MKPILIIYAFNRPHKLREVLEALRRQTIKPPQIIAFVDGQRYEAEHDVVQDCVNQLHKVENCTVHWREKNYGCAANIMLGIEQVIKDHESFVVLEDDVVPAASWYESLSLMLNHYKDNPKVATVGSFPTTLRGKLNNYPYDVFVTPRFSCWGWGATTKSFCSIVKRWKSYRAGSENSLTKITDSLGIDIAHMIQSDHGHQHLWDAVVAAIMMDENKVQAVTKNFMTTNTGADLHLEYHQNQLFILNSTLQNKIPESFPESLDVQPNVRAVISEYINHKW